jgi:hypothetical protein
MIGCEMNPLSVEEGSMQCTTFSTQKFLVYPFIHGEQVELAAKDLPLCDFVGVYEVDKLVTLQMDHVHGRNGSHFLTCTEHDRRALNPRTWINDTVVDFWFRWIARNEPFDNVVISFTSHFYSTLIKSNSNALISNVENETVDVPDDEANANTVINGLHWELDGVINEEPSEKQPPKQTTIKSGCEHLFKTPIDST